MIYLLISGTTWDFLQVIFLETTNWICFRCFFRWYIIHFSGEGTNMGIVMGFTLGGGHRLHGLLIDDWPILEIGIFPRCIGAMSRECMDLVWLYRRRSFPTSTWSLGNSWEFFPWRLPWDHHGMTWAVAGVPGVPGVALYWPQKTINPAPLPATISEAMDSQQTGCEWTATAWPEDLVSSKETMGI